MDKARVIINADYSDNTPYSGMGVGIAILDTGLSPSIDFSAPLNRIVVFKDFVNGFDRCYDDNGHGTHVCGIACGNGNLSNKKYEGIAPNANLIVLKILDKYGRGSASTALTAIQWIIENKKRYNIRVVNMSVGTSDRNINSSLIYSMYKAWDSGICIITADGNAGSGNSSITAAGKSKKIITVGNFEIPSYNCDVTAPGIDIVSCMSPDYSFGFHGRSRKKIVSPYYVMMSGTSMSTPMVSGAAALLIEKYPDIKPQEIKQRLLYTCGINKLINVKRLLDQ
ncbi:Serine protease AprX [bioreactor metagenome]|uniref:Serine protease AprX n=1 Tax=bioreactor metagenome TaxID=1076179 RepID=A0A644Y222_9ZZZZ|nr:S8 family peptidase [Candidatus Metalachnospira sp.]